MGMTRHTHLRRALAVAASGCLAAGLAGLPGAASALTPAQVYIAQGSSQADSACTVTSGSSYVHLGPKNLHHGRSKGGVDLITTWTNGGDLSDVTTVSGHYGGKTHLTKHNGAFKSATLTGSGHLSISRALGNASTCDVSANLVNAIETVTNQPKGWYYITRNTSKSSLSEIIVSKNATLAKPVIFEAYQGGANSVTQRAFVKPGQYFTLLVAGIEGGDFPVLTGKNGGTVSRGSLANSMSAQFYTAGSALGGAKGTGTRFVKFPGSLSCSHHSATLTWKSGASKVATGSFLVNGKKKASVTGPKAGKHVVLRHLSKTADNTITANLSLKGGGSATASAAFVPCSD
ncbi:MAG: hypothetical protein WB797_17540 [Nocardioides sp.]